MKKSRERSWWQTFAHQLKGAALVVAMIAMGLSGTSLQAETVVAPCMQDAAGFNLNCTANDIQLSEVTEEDVTIIKPCRYPGDTTTFEAKFTTVLTAKARHDLGIYFAIDGDVNGDGALTGDCSVSSLEYQPTPKWLDLDGVSDPYVGQHKASGKQDTCGDIDSSHNPLRPVIRITTTCVDSDNDGNLDLPYCTSWRQSGANELCTGPVSVEFGAGDFSSGVIPGAPSKCNCNPGFNVPVPVPPAKLNVVKSVVPDSVSEPGGSVVYSVSVSNFGVDPNNPVTITSLNDGPYGDITEKSNLITDTDCAIGAKLIPGAESYTCNFTVAIKGNAGLEIPDTVTVTGLDARGNTITGSDDALVTITGADPTIIVKKVAFPKQVLEPGGDVQFTVSIENTSVSSDPVTINTLYDSVHGNLNGQGDCGVPVIIAPLETHTCTFNAFVGGLPNTNETDIVTADGVDDEGTTVTGSASANVAINDVPSSIELIKIGAVEIIDEPGGNVEFTYTVTNKSAVDTVTIDSLVDVVGGETRNLDGAGSCAVPFDLAPGTSRECKATFFVGGNAGESVTNTSTASGLDDDDIPVSASDTFTVNLRNVPPNARLVKTAESVIVNYSVVVTNLSVAESATINSLSDDVYGDITDNYNDLIIKTNCSKGVELTINGSEGDSYTCNFSALAESSPTVDTVTGVVSDNEGGTVSPSDSASVTFQ